MGDMTFPLQSLSLSRILVSTGRHHTEELLGYAHKPAEANGQGCVNRNMQIYLLDWAF